MAIQKLDKTRHFGLVAPEGIDKMWAAAELLTKQGGWLSIDDLGTFLEDCQRRADRVHHHEIDANTFYALKPDLNRRRGWTDEIMILTIRACYQRGIFEMKRIPERGRYVRVGKPKDYYPWKRSSELLPADPGWNYTFTLLNIKEAAP